MDIVDHVKQGMQAPYKAVCRELAVPYSSLMRWKRRRRAGLAVVRKPGPAKVEPLDLQALYDEILGLDHGRHRTRGTTALYARYRDQISRRDLQGLVEAARRELRQAEQALARRIDWLVPGLVWSMDDTQHHWLQERFGHIHLVMDLGSHYNLRALGADVQANGVLVALNLEALFLCYGSPLFMKMDGGSNFRHQAVQALFGEHGVIPLVSPPYYPPYNGSIERGHQLMLTHLAARIGNDRLTARELRLESEVSAYEMNHTRRHSLGNRTACATLERGRPLVGLFGRRERKEVFEEIKAMTVDITEMLGEHTTVAVETAFRYAAETWMQLNHMIRVTQQGEVLPPFYRFQSH
jgi:hypothetical protein